jgi:hypothetical protein
LQQADRADWLALIVDELSARLSGERYIAGAQHEQRGEAKGGVFK